MDGVVAVFDTLCEAKTDGLGWVERCPDVNSKGYAVTIDNIELKDRVVIHNTHCSDDSRNSAILVLIQYKALLLTDCHVQPLPRPSLFVTSEA